MTCHRTLRIASFAAVVALGAAPRAAVGESVNVTARTTLWAEVSEHDGVLRGWLADDLGERLPNERVVVSSGAVRRVVVTDDAGEFEVPLPAGARAQRVALEYGGGAFHQGASLVREVDPSRLPVRLELVVPTVISDPESAVEVQVRAERNGAPEALPVAIVMPGSAQVLATGRTDATGWAHLSFDPRVLARPGRHDLHAVFDGDSARAPALARAETVVVDATTLDLRSATSSVFPDQEVRLSGTLLGTFAPLPGREVEIAVGGRRVAAATTTNGGAFAVAIRGETLGASGPVEILARFDSPATALGSSESQPVRVVVATPRPLAIGAVAAPAAATLAVVVAVLLLTRRRAGGEGAAPARVSMLPIATGLRPSIAPHRTLRRSESLGFDGTVWDPVEDRPVVRATVELAVGPEPLARVTASDGAFTFDALPRGRHRASVEAAGYVPEAFEVAVPHGGQYNGTRITLVQVRHRALEVYREIARPLLPDARLWGVWTPREVAIHAVSAHPWITDEVAALTSCFEAIYYSNAVGSMSDLAHVEGLADALARSRSRASRGVEGGG